MGTQGTKTRQKSTPKHGSTGPTPTLTGWVLVFVAGACMFVLGVVVGRNTAPVNFDMANLDRKMTQLSPSVMAEEKNPDKPAAKKDLDKMPFEFYDKLKEETLDRDADSPPQVKTPRFEKQPEKTALAYAEVKTAEKKTPVKPARNETSSEAATPKEPAKQDSQTAAASEPAAKPAPKPAPKGAYAIQVASLRDPEKAETVRDKFRDKGYPAYTQQAMVEGKGQWSRVRIGPYRAKKQAQSDLARLHNAGVDAILFLTD